MSGSGYVAVPKAGDLAAQYRYHAQLVADGERPKAARAVLIEFDEQGVPTMRLFGSYYTTQREAIHDLLEAVQSLNAEAST